MTRTQRLASAVPLILLTACSGADGTGVSDAGTGATDAAPPQPLVTATGTASVAGQAFTLAYGASNVFSSGTVNIVLSTMAMNSGTLTATRIMNGTFVEIQISSAAKGIPATHVVMFDVISGGNGTGGGSGNGTVEVLDVSDSIITIRVAYQDTANGVAYAINGDFGVVRCP